MQDQSFSETPWKSNTWLSIAGFTCLINLLRTNYNFDEFVCQQWHQHDISRNRWGTKLKVSSFKILLSLTCVHSNTLKFYSLLLNFINLTFQCGNYKEFPSRRENYGEPTYVLRHLTMYSWWILQLSSARIILQLWLKLVPAIGYFVNSGQLWFLSGTIIDEQRASKTEKKIDHGNVLSQRRGVSQYIREAYEHTERKGHPQIAWKLQETVSIL